MQSKLSCVVCAASLERIGTFHIARTVPADAYPTCFAVACRMIVSRRTEMGEPGFRHYLEVQATRIKRQHALNQQASASLLRHEQENERGWKMLRALLPAGEVEPLRLLLPSGPRRARKIGLQRRAHYRAHLEALVAQVRQIGEATPVESASVPAPFPAPIPSSSIPGRLCGMCSGGCCTRGGDHAYLDAHAVRALLARQPGLSDQEIVTAYLKFLPVRSQNGSCINHTSRGCALPREMRSSTCNKYACEALAQLQNEQRLRATVGAVIVIQRELDNWRRSAIDMDDPVTAYAVLTEQRLRRVTANFNDDFTS